MVSFTNLIECFRFRVFDFTCAERDMQTEVGVGKVLRESGKSFQQVSSTFMAAPEGVPPSDRFKATRLVDFS